MGHVAARAALVVSVAALGMAFWAWVRASNAPADILARVDDPFSASSIASSEALRRVETSAANTDADLRALIAILDHDASRAARPLPDPPTVPEPRRSLFVARGSGDARTDQFRTTSEWAIVWRNPTGGPLSIAVVSFQQSDGLDGSVTDTPVRVSGETEGSVVVRRPGQYRLAVTASGPWALTVAAPK